MDKDKKVKELAEYIEADFEDKCADRYCGNGCGYYSEEFNCRFYFTLQYLIEKGLLKAEDIKCEQ